MKKLKVISYPWHISHQYELAKLPFFEEYHFLINPYRSWNEGSRPLPEKIKFVTHYKPGYYDFALLHIDQQAIWDPELSKKYKWARLGKGRLYYEANQLIKDIPKVVINHMTPFHDHLESDQVIEIMEKLTKGNHMVVNSFEAGKQWGWGTPIIHGLEVDEWWDLPKEPRCTIVLSKGGMERAYRRVFARATVRLLKQMKVPTYWLLNDFTCNTFDEYREFLGSSLVFFMPTWNSPRPRARTEAMLSGCCIVSTPYQDADTFIEHGVNGFLTSQFKITDPRVMDNPQKSADLIKRLVLDEPDLALEIGQQGKKTARKLFNKKEFAKQWKDFLTEIGVFK